MKIAVSATGPQLNDLTDERFGRCAYFVIFDDQGNLQQTISNEAQQASGGAGIKAAQTLINSGVKVLLTGRVGPKAMPALKAGGVSIFTGSLGTVEETLQHYQNGLMRPLTTANSGRHAGLS